MKSIILSFLLLSTTLSLVPFVAFSRCFTSNNPIVLPTTTHNNLILPSVLDVDGDQLKTDEKYIILNPFIGAGSVYLDNIGHLKCPNAVLQHIQYPGFMGPGTPVKFFLKKDANDVVREMYAIDIMFSVNTSSPCVNETVWKVGDKEFVVTGGTLGNENNIFKIMKQDIEIRQFKYIYKLLYCPPQLMCKDVSVTKDNGYFRLVAVDNNPIPIVFMKEKNA